MNQLSTILAAFVWAIPVWLLAHYGYTPVALGMIGFAVVVGNCNERANSLALAGMIARVLSRQR